MIEALLMCQARGGQHMVVVDFEKSLLGTGLSQGGAKRAQADIGAPPWGGRQGPAIDDRVQQFDVGRQQAAGRRDNLAYLRMRQRLRQDVLPHLAGGAKDQQGFRQFGRVQFRSNRSRLIRQFGNRSRAVQAGGRRPSRIRYST